MNLRTSFSNLRRRYLYERPRAGYRKALSRSMPDPDFIAQAPQLCTDGILILSSYFHGETLRAMQQDFDEAARQTPADEHGATFLDESVVRNSAALSRAGGDPYLTTLARYYWGKPVVLARTSGYRIEPRMIGDYSSFQWHHDAKWKQVKVHILLTDVPRDGQRMDYLPGTNRLWHRWETYEETRFTPASVEIYGPPVQCVGPAGTVIVFDTNGLHRGNRNLGPRRDLWQYSYVAGKA